MRLRLCLAALSLLFAVPAEARVVITFWSHELGNSFPHAFFTLRGVPDAGGAAVDTNYGFTAKSLTPAILMGTVAGRFDVAKPSYINGSDAQFSVELTDRQYNDVLALIAAWDAKTGNSRYNLNTRNCVHFVQEAARRAGLVQVEFPRLMKKPRSYLKAVAAANPGAVIPVGMHGKAYLATLAPITPAAPVAIVTPAPAP